MDPEYSHSWYWCGFARVSIEKDSPNKARVSMISNTYNAPANLWEADITFWFVPEIKRVFVLKIEAVPNEEGYMWDDTEVSSATVCMNAEDKFVQAVWNLYEVKNGDKKSFDGFKKRHGKKLAAQIAAISPMIGNVSCMANIAKFMRPYWFDFKLEGTKAKKPTK